ncbi:28S ribosomal protein S18c, mitochondrial [Lampris incognitus]|uniref:28S ribosomal protein S18c, mitochondrial n=1 Tax=Lampris incognitus TaxID=2546036 RepID=UPI0024B5FCC7|nr:28S ribosomal protein S18c, mitochondrial [Lampris incognitus]
MFALRGRQSLKRAVCHPGLTSLRSPAGAQNPVPQDDHTPVKMENPYRQPEKGCVLCSTAVDFKNVQLLSQFVSPHTGRIYGRHITGLCGVKQRQVSKAIKKAISMGFMSVTHKHPQFMRDPNICNIKSIE